MRIIRADALGMCFGVRDALEIARQIDRPGEVTIHGELVHNEAVLRELSERGFAVAERANGSNGSDGSYGSNGSNGNNESDRSYESHESYDSHHSHASALYRNYQIGHRINFCDEFVVGLLRCGNQQIFILDDVSEF